MIFNLNESDINDYIEESKNSGAAKRIVKSLGDDLGRVRTREKNIDTAAISNKRKDAERKKIDNEYDNISSRGRKLLGGDFDDIEYIGHADDAARGITGHNPRYNIGTAGNAMLAAKRSLGYEASTRHPKNSEMHETISKRKPGGYLEKQQDKRRKLKEAAEYILGILDESDRRLK